MLKGGIHNQNNATEGPMLIAPPAKEICRLTGQTGKHNN